MPNADSLITDLLTVDVELGLERVSQEPPSVQRHILERCLSQAAASRQNDVATSKFLAFAKSILAGTYPQLTGPEAIEWLETFVEFAAKQTDSELRGQSLTLSVLLAHRARESISLLPGSTERNLQRILDSATSDRERAISHGLLDYIAKATERIRARTQRSNRTFAVQDLELRRAAENVSRDMQGDWYQDPWGWPETEWLVGHAVEKVWGRLKDAKCGWTVPLDVAKQGDGVRPALVINPLDRLAYQALVDDISLPALGTLPQWVYGWRLARPTPEPGKYLDNGSEWRAFRKLVSKNAADFSFTAHLDIQSFFSSVDTSALISTVARRYRNNPVLDRLDAYFDAWHQHANGSGIPQRCLASSVLAHVLLHPLDTFLNRLTAGGTSSQSACARWMDDIWVFEQSEERLRRHVNEIEVILDQVRLSLNSEKTILFTSRDSADAVELLDRSSAEETGPTSSGLSPETILRQAEDAPRFRVSFAVKKMIGTRDFSSLEGLSPDRLKRFSHIADHLAQALRVSGLWRHYVDWYVQYSRRHVSEETWAVAAWGEMFPNKFSKSVTKVHEFFARCLDLRLLPRIAVPLAAQRLSAWHKGGQSAQEVMNGLRLATDAFELRSLCYAALASGADKATIRGVAEQIDDEVTIDFLRHTNFEAPSLSSRFTSE